METPSKETGVVEKMKKHSRREAKEQHFEKDVPKPKNTEHSSLYYCTFFQTLFICAMFV